MAGIAILLELLRKNPKFDPTQTPHCFGYLPAKVAISAAAAASVAATYPFGFRAFIRIDVCNRESLEVAHCDAAPAWSTDPSIHNIPGYVFESDSLSYSSKVYNIEVKVPFSAFQWKVLAVTSLRSFLLNYCPLMVPRTNLENDGKCFLHDSAEEHHIDLVSPFKKSVKQIIHEVGITMFPSNLSFSFHFREVLA